MEDVRCIFCREQREYPVVIEENGYTGRKCRKCGLVFLSPRPNASDITAMYKHDESHGSSAESEIAKSFVSRLLARHKILILSRHMEGGELLEIGAGAGYFLDEIRKKGFDVSATEINEAKAEFIRKHLKIACEVVPLDQAFGTKKFDVIYHCNVLSHFYKPISEFHEMAKRLTDDGILMFETGNIGDINERFYSAFAKFEYPDHLFFFGEKSIQNLLVSTGFRLIETHRYVKLYEIRLLASIERLMKIQKAFLGFIRHGKRYTDVSDTNHGDKGKLRILRNFVGLVCYFLTYRIGSHIRKNGRPQTIIFVARKSASTQPDRFSSQHTCVS